MTSKLSLYNGALEHLKERHLGSLTENREPRYKLDFAFDDAVRYCLEQGFWNFATRTVQLDKSAGILPAFGPAYVFEKPADWLRTVVISGSPNLSPALEGYRDEADYWIADTDPLFVSYISAAPEYGFNLTRWPQTFASYVAAWLAFRVCSTAGSEELRVAVEKRAKVALIDARSKDAMNQPVGRLPQGSWTRARGGRSGER